MLVNKPKKWLPVREKTSLQSTAYISFRTWVASFCLKILKQNKPS